MAGLTLEFNLPKELNPQLEPEQRFDPQTGKLEFNPSAAQGQLVLSSPEDSDSIKEHRLWLDCL